MDSPTPREHEVGCNLDRRALGRFLRDARRTRKLSQAVVAKAVGISPVFVSQIETGQRIPSDRVAKDLALALELPWQEVLRSVYVLRSKEAGELFAPAEGQGEPVWQSVSQIPAVRFLIMQLAELNLPRADIEELVRNWRNDVAFLKAQLAKAHGQ